MTHTTLDLDRLAERVATRSAPVRRALTGPLLVAGRDDDVTGGALTIAELLARRDRVNAHVLTLVPPLPFTASLLTDIDAAALEAGRLAEQRARVRQRVHQTVGQLEGFTFIEGLKS